MLLRSLLIGLSLIATVHAAEAPTSDAGRQAIARLPPLVGVWEGEGWMRSGPGEPQHFVGEERVETRLEGHALLIEGKHFTSDRSRIVHNALAIVSFDESAGDYHFRTQVTGREPADFRGHLEGDAFVWEMPNPRGKIRYIIRVVDDQWIEKGEMESANGWQQFFEMKLKRAGAAGRAE